MLFIAILVAMGAGCDAPKEKSPDEYFTPLFENKSIAVTANQPSEQILDVKPALCYRIFGEASADPVTVTVIDDSGAPVRTTNSENGKFEIGKAHGFCTRVIKGPYYVRFSSKNDATVTLSVSKSQSGGI